MDKDYNDDEPPSDFPASSESLDPTDMLACLRPGWARWSLHLKEPACVVGEHRQLFRTLAVFLRLTGDDGMDRDGVLLVSIDRFWKKLWDLSEFSIFVLGFSAILKPTLTEGAFC
ncbi:uronate isomerase [Striga asiatica]|uniref:Uronate isomerase n=1 Tax=Striga asiatica TaxID=4170 RepID=A0A5A7RCK7_STRAF|nr:uronate isomerase [Striga asiatica]